MSFVKTAPNSAIYMNLYNSGNFLYATSSLLCLSSSSETRKTQNYYAHDVRREAGEARKKSISFFFSGCPSSLSRLAARRSRLRALPLVNLQKKRTARSLISSNFIHVLACEHRRISFCRFSPLEK